MRGVCQISPTWSLDNDVPKSIFSVPSMITENTPLTETLCAVPETTVFVPEALKNSTPRHLQRLAHAFDPLVSYHVVHRSRERRVADRRPATPLGFECLPTPGWVTAKLGGLNLGIFIPPHGKISCCRPFRADSDIADPDFYSRRSRTVRLFLLRIAVQ